MYKASERGKKAIDTYENVYKTKKYVDTESMFEPFAKYYIIGNDTIEKTKNNFRDDVWYANENYKLLKINYNEISDVRTFFEWLIDNSNIYGLIKPDKEEDKERGFSFSETWSYYKKGEYRNIGNYIHIVSTLLYLKRPDLFKPILVADHFDIIIKHCDILGINLPPIPPRNNHKARIMYYCDICEAFEKYQKANNLTSGEFCACLYDYASMFEEKQTNKELPEPTNIWLTGGSKEDYKDLEEFNGTNEGLLWAGNEETKKGDIIVLYCRTPYSCIHSIWRAKYDGVINPFDYYYCRTYVTQGIKVEPIHFSELKSDAYTSNIPIVRKNLQGIYGVKLTAKDYTEIQRLIREKGFDTSTLPQLYSPNLDINITVKNEKDVEEKLLIPLLEKLGYSEHDWNRQLSQKAGRGLKAIPDFVFFPYGEEHFQNAPFVLEAKFDMRNMTEKTNAFNQALSYCKMMSASILALCDKERLIIYRKERGIFDRNNPIFEKHWGSINDNSVFTELKKIIGRYVVERMK